MANLTAAREDFRQDGELVLYPVKGSTKLYKGSIVAIDTGGYAVKGADTANYRFAGIAYETVDNTGADGAKTIRCWRKGVFELNTPDTATQASVGKLVYISDDNNVALAATTTNDVVVGEVTEFVSASKLRVDIGRRV